MIHFKRKSRVKPKKVNIGLELKEIDYLLELLYERKAEISYAATGEPEESNKEYLLNRYLRVQLESQREKLQLF